MGELVESLVGHSAGEAALTDHCDDVPPDALAKPRLGDAEGVAERCRGVAVLNQVVLGLFARRVPGKAAGLPESREVLCATCDDLVHVSLMACVPDNCIFRAVEDPMESKSQLDHAEVGGEMATGL